MNVFASFFSSEESSALAALVAGRDGEEHFKTLGWENSYSLVNPNNEGFVNVIKVNNLPRLQVEKLSPLEGGRKAYNKASQRLRKQLQKGEEGRVVCTPFVMERVSLFGGWLLQENWLQFHGTLKLEEKKIPLHFWSKEGRIILPKVKLRNQAQYQACLNAGLI